MELLATRQGRSIVLGILVLLFGSYMVLTFQMPLGTFANPGPGFFPVIIGILGILCSLSLLPYLWQDKGLTTSKPMLKIPKEVLTLSGGVIAYALVMYVAGFAVATAAYGLFILRRYSTRSWVFSSVVAVSFAAILYFVFSALLNVNLP